MKFKKYAKNILILSLLTITIVASGIIVNAVPETNVQEIATEAQTVAPQTEAPTYAPETEPVTYAPETEAPTYAPETEAPTYAPDTEDYTEEETQAETEAETEAETKLPKAKSETSPTAIRVDEKKVVEKDDLTYGYVSWGCVIFGVIAVIVILISNKNLYSGGSGKYRYDSGNMMNGSNNMLDEKYYKNRKTNSYHRKDGRG